MLVGINTNAKYQGEIYHIQTEDGGINNPVIVTQIFKEGAIISSCKKDYNDIIGLEYPAKMVKERMQEQHKRLLKDLYAGKFDDKTSGVRSRKAEGRRQKAEETFRSQKATTEHANPPFPPLNKGEGREFSEKKKEVRRDKRVSLDDVILNYLAEVEEEDLLNDNKGIRE
ncbi:MAG: hypothetical protein ACE5EA_05320 [Nitrospirota bacterium]